MSQPNLSEKEKQVVGQITNCLDKLRHYLATQEPSADWDLAEWFAHPAQIKEILGNFSNRVTFLASLLARDYLSKLHRLSDPVDIASKSMSSPGPDIRAITTDNEEVVAEVKTTVPCAKKDFGANQRKSVRNDFKKLKESEAAYKYFFLTDPMAYQIIVDRYAKEISGVTVVCLTTGEKLRA